MKIAFYKSKHGKILDKIISLFTFSEYSHCELVFSDGMCASSSSRDGGIRFKQIDLGHKWDVFHLNLDLDEQQVRDWFHSHINHKYDWTGALGSAFGVDLTMKNRKFCSYSCAKALGMYNCIISPGKLFKKFRAMGFI